MDGRFALIGVPLAQAVMAAQRDEGRHHAVEAYPYWLSAERAQAQTPQPQVSYRASGWRALPGIAAVWRLLAVRRPGRAV